MRIPLATAAEKVGSVVTLIILAGLSAVLVCTFDGTAFWLVFVVCVFLIVPLGLYTAAVFQASAAVNDKDRKICVHGIGAGTYDAGDASSVSTEEVLLGSLVTRRIIFRNAAGAETASISTLITVHHGAKAEVAALALADALKLQFIPTVEKHHYDRQARREKQRADKESGKRATEQRALVPDEKPEVNYDELDDLP